MSFSVFREGNSLEAEKSVENADYEDRSYSPASQGNRSQDSGFSDSDSSAEEGTPTGRRRRIRNRERRHRRPRNHRLSSLWRENEVPPNPAHHSTPKRLVLRFNDQESRSRIDSSWELPKLERYGTFLIFCVIWSFLNCMDFIVDDVETIETSRYKVDFISGNPEICMLKPDWLLRAAIAFLWIFWDRIIKMEHLS